MPRPIVRALARGSTILLLIVTVIPHTAAAQGTTGSFEQLQVIVKPGDTITVIDAAGREMTGKVADLSSSSLGLLANGARRELSESDVSTIKQRRNDSLANGAIIGLAIGVGASAALVIAVSAIDSSEVDAGLAALAIGAYGGMGAGIGVGVDALIRQRKVVYQRSPTSGLHVGIAPWLTRERRGVLVTVRF